MSSDSMDDILDKLNKDLDEFDLEAELNKTKKS